MKEHYCWRCKIIVPMLEEHEWQVIEPLLVPPSRIAREYRETHGVGLKTALDNCFKPVLAKYFELTGFTETNHLAILHHRLSLYGDECPNCGHLFRTPKASFCASCGYEKNPDDCANYPE